MFKVGRVINYYEKIGVAIVELEGTLAVHDKIRFLFDHDYLFSQVVEAIQIGHEKVESANRGSKIGLPIKERVQVGTDIFKEN